ncbi:unnamed protein product, partial [Ectocarpus sp. 4 AP-2014]
GHRSSSSSSSSSERQGRTERVELGDSALKEQRGGDHHRQHLRNPHQKSEPRRGKVDRQSRVFPRLHRTRSLSTLSRGWGASFL